METSRFYDEIADVYHLIYPEWEKSISRHASALDSIIRDRLGSGTKALLDVSCGIGTQSLGLAQIGHTVTASDVSLKAIERARREAAMRGLSIPFSVGDVRQCDKVNYGQFDVVISADNSIPHLLTDEDIRTAFRAMFRCLRSDGLVVLSVRDYEQEDRTPLQLRPYGVRITPEGRVLVLQVWEFEGNTDLYEVSMFFVVEPRTASTYVISSKAHYYAVPITRLCELLKETGFTRVERIDDRFFQPVLVGRKTESVSDTLTSDDLRG